MKMMLLALSLMPGPAVADDPLPPGLVEARLLPGWTTPDGARMAALELKLEPGWKTYWRSPGDTGLPPTLDFEGSRNAGAVTIHWPAPEVIDSDGGRTLGYHDALVLPFTVAPATPGQPVDLRATVEFGLCDTVCVPALVRLTAPPAGTAPDPVIEAALARVPAPAPDHPACHFEDIKDGVRVTLTPEGPMPEAAAIELAGHPDVWVSSATIAATTVTADLVGPEGTPFPVDPAAILFTRLDAQGATESLGCRG